MTATLRKPPLPHKQKAPVASKQWGFCGRWVQRQQQLDWTQQTFDAAASVAQSWLRLKRSPNALAVASPYHAVAVFVGLYNRDGFACLVGDIDHSAVVGRIQAHQILALRCIAGEVMHCADQPVS
jgi:hypothetical protein